MQQAGLQAIQSTDQLYGQIGQAQAQGATAQAGVLGQAALLGGFNINGALAGSGG